MAKKEESGLFSVPEQTPFRFEIKDGAPSVLLQEGVAKVLLPLKCLATDRPPRFSLKYLNDSTYKAVQSHGSESVDNPQKVRLKFSISEDPATEGIDSKLKRFKEGADGLFPGRYQLVAQWSDDPNETVVLIELNEK